MELMRPLLLGGVNIKRTADQDLVWSKNISIRDVSLIVYQWFLRLYPFLIYADMEKSYKDGQSVSEAGSRSKFSITPST